MLGLGALVLAVVALAQTGVVALPGSLAPLGAPLALLGVALIWRDSPTLFALNLAGVLSVGGAGVSPPAHRRPPACRAGRLRRRRERARGAAPPPAPRRSY